MEMSFTDSTNVHIFLFNSLFAMELLSIATNNYQRKKQFEASSTILHYSLLLNVEEEDMSEVVTSWNQFTA